ncbi:MAG: hypothetical protein ACREMX_14065 [Gemmatimonadales bacterium]
MPSSQTLAIGLLAGALACAQSEPRTARGASLEADWTGRDTGRIAAPAVAEWCDTLRVLEIRATQGDSGIALAFYPSGALVSGSYPLRPPERADSVRPGAAVALRWFGETMIRGFRGDSGAVELDRSPAGALSGRFTASMLSTTDTGRLVLRGSFRALSVKSGTRGCTARPARPAADTGVD